MLLAELYMNFVTESTNFMVMSDDTHNKNLVPRYPIFAMAVCELISKLLVASPSVENIKWTLNILKVSYTIFAAHLIVCLVYVYNLTYPDLCILAYWLVHDQRLKSPARSFEFIFHAPRDGIKIKHGTKSKKHFECHFCSQGKQLGSRSIFN